MTAKHSAGGVPVPRVRGRLRGAILKRAADMASLDGLEHVSIGRLAEAMQMSKSGLYAYFASKEDLQLATIDCAWRTFEEHVLEPAEGKLDALLELWLAYYEHGVFPGGCPFVTAGTEFANRNGPVHDSLADAIDLQLAALQHAVTGAQGSRVPGDGDPSQLAFELHALLTAANLRFRMSGDMAAFAQARKAIARLLQSPA